MPKRLLKSSNKAIVSNSKYISIGTNLLMPISQLSNNFGLSVKGFGTITIDWSDGLVETFGLTDTFLYISHTWVEPSIPKYKKFTLLNSENITGLENLVNNDFSTFSFDVKFLPNLEYINIQFRTSIMGDLYACPKLNFCRLAGINSLSGNMSLISPNLIGISLHGRNRLYGVCSFMNCSVAISGNNSISGIFSALGTYSYSYLTPILGPISISLSGYNTVSGINFEEPTYVLVSTLHPTHIIPFSPFNFRKLCFFAMAKTIFTVEQQNAILQGIWDNRDFVKERAERSIDIRGAVGTPALDSAGLALKSLLQAYVSPGISSITWVVLNR